MARGIVCVCVAIYCVCVCVCVCVYCVWYCVAECGIVCVIDWLVLLIVTLIVGGWLIGRCTVVGRVIVIRTGVQIVMQRCKQAYCLRF
jgi:hypothetical protein